MLFPAVHAAAATPDGAARQVVCPGLSGYGGAYDKSDWVCLILASRQLRQARGAVGGAVHPQLVMNIRCCDDNDDDDNLL